MKRRRFVPLFLKCKGRFIYYCETFRVNSFLIIVLYTFFHLPYSAEKRRLYSEAEELYSTALKLLGPRDSCGATSIWELVSWELSCHLYSRAVLMQDYPGVYADVSFNIV